MKIHGLLLATLSFIALPAHAGVVINDLMYRPHNQSTVGRYEFIELYNDGGSSVDLSGFILTDSQDLGNICAGIGDGDVEGVFQIPNGTVMGAGEIWTFWHTSIAGVTNQPRN